MLQRAWTSFRLRVVHGANRTAGAYDSRAAYAKAGTVAKNTMPLPSVMLWAWERPDDLRAVAPTNAGVAYLAGTIYIREVADEDTATSAAVSVAYRPRLQTLQIAANSTLLPVVRIDTIQPSGGDADRSLAADQVHRAVEILARTASISAGAPPRIQIDFDATESERESYVALLIALRARLGADARISITALASWCEGDAWLRDLPAGTIDEAVPMLSAWAPMARMWAIRSMTATISPRPCAARAQESPMTSRSRARSSPARSRPRSLRGLTNASTFSITARGTPRQLRRTWENSRNGTPNHLRLTDCRTIAAARCAGHCRARVRAVFF